MLSIEKSTIHKELVAIRRNIKITKSMRSEMREIFKTMREIDHSLADLYYLLREVQLKVYKR